ncbi:peptidyl-tRNA hydrolase ICT1, mitochondrial isoform X1 [Kryptolebias marmoratus]|uniref:peptidyl-tRNA hydrolase ICT1, mitochondrial isoform X1 n=1 Tax=Kryptolebias marmoratus TaxID=37003 RepID=UPI0007F8BAFB|nr:peptidyl-tRNA hydrolase ICT1, mitochondrial isoform X1 [Kryptolebias marmoratus]
MAAHIARRACFFCCAEMKVVSHCRSAVLRLNNNASSRIYYGTRGTDDTEWSWLTVKATQSILTFTGHPSAHSNRLSVSYSRSSGPGGQHVNKVNTKAEVRFHLHTADWIPEDVRQKILEKNRNRINKAGELLVTSEMSRRQQRNLSDCVRKIAAIIAEASVKHREATAEDIALRAARLEKRNKERLRQKKISSTIKQSRRGDFD